MHEFDGKSQKQFDDFFLPMAKLIQADSSARDRLDEMLHAKTREIIQQPGTKFVRSSKPLKHLSRRMSSPTITTT